MMPNDSEQLKTPPAPLPPNVEQGVSQPPQPHPLAVSLEQLKRQADNSRVAEGSFPWRVAAELGRVTGILVWLLILWPIATGINPLLLGVVAGLGLLANLVNMVKQMWVSDYQRETYLSMAGLLGNLFALIVLVMTRTQ